MFRVEPHANQYIKQHYKRLIIPIKIDILYVNEDSWKIVIGAMQRINYNYNIKRMRWSKIIKWFQPCFHCLWKSEIILQLYLGKIFWEVRSLHMLAPIPNIHTVSLWQVINRNVSLNLMGFALLRKHFLPKYFFFVTVPTEMVDWYSWIKSFLHPLSNWKKFHRLYF